MADEVKPKGTFQSHVAEAFAAVVNDVMAEHPELRGVAVVFDWVDGLNAGAIPGIWHDRKGQIAPGNCDAILGSMEQTCKILRVQAEMGMQVVIALQRAAANQAKQLEQAQERLRATSAELEDTKGDNPQEPGSDEAEKTEGKETTEE